MCPPTAQQGGHRRYGEREVRRLYRILALRSLGFRLEEVGSLLDVDDAAGLLDTTRLQLDRVERDLEQIERLRKRLVRVVAAPERSEEPSADQLIKTMEAMTMTIHLGRLYTRAGDDGQTDLDGRRRVAKTDVEVEAVGAIDELTSHLGLAAAVLDSASPVRDVLARVQADLFDLGARRLSPEHVAWLEERCDEHNAALSELDSFVLPGGSQASAQLHVSRAVCRRAERRALAVPEPIGEAIRYLNRLPDLLYILARAVNTVPEQLWGPARSEPS